MKELVFFLEEESAKALLEQIVPLLIPAGSKICPRFIVFEGKQDFRKATTQKATRLPELAGTLYCDAEPGPERLPEDQEIPCSSLHARRPP